MADAEWIRNLATASYKGGQWVPEDPESIQTLAASRIEQSLQALYEEAVEACEIFNTHAVGKRRIRLLPLRPESGEGAPGFLLLFGKTQIKISYVPHRLTAVLSSMRGFSHVTKTLHTFDPHVDAFGSLLWCMDNGLLLTSELIIKRLLEDLAQAAALSGEF